MAKKAHRRPTKRTTPSPQAVGAPPVRDPHTMERVEARARAQVFGWDMVLWAIRAPAFIIPRQLINELEESIRRGMESRGVELPAYVDVLRTAADALR